MISHRPIKLSSTQLDLARAALKELSEGGHLMETRSDANEWFYFRTSSGQIITEQVIQRLEDAELIEPSGDGLFGDSQTYRIKQLNKGFESFCDDWFGRNWVKARNGSKAALKHQSIGGRVIKKSELDSAKQLHAIAQAFA